MSVFTYKQTYLFTYMYVYMYMHIYMYIHINISIYLFLCKENRSRYLYIHCVSFSPDIVSAYGVGTAQIKKCDMNIALPVISHLTALAAPAG